MLSVQIARCFPCRVPQHPQHPMFQRHRTLRANRSKLGRISFGTPAVRQSFPTTGWTYGGGIAGCIRERKAELIPRCGVCFTIHLGIAWKHRAAKSEPIERFRWGRLWHSLRSQDRYSCSQRSWLVRIAVRSSWFTIDRMNRCFTETLARCGSINPIRSSFNCTALSRIPRRRRRFRSGSVLTGSAGASGISGLSRFRLESNASRTEHGSSLACWSGSEDALLRLEVSPSLGIRVREQRVGRRCGFEQPPAQDLHLCLWICFFHSNSNPEGRDHAQAPS